MYVDFPGLASEVDDLSAVLDKRERASCPASAQALSSRSRRRWYGPNQLPVAGGMNGTLGPKDLCMRNVEMPPWKE